MNRHRSGSFSIRCNGGCFLVNYKVRRKEVSHVKIFRSFEDAIKYCFFLTRLLGVDNE